MIRSNYTFSLSTSRFEFPFEEQSVYGHVLPNLWVALLNRTSFELVLHQMLLLIYSSVFSKHLFLPDRETRNCNPIHRVIYFCICSRNNWNSNWKEKFDSKKYLRSKSLWTASIIQFINVQEYIWRRRKRNFVFLLFFLEVWKHLYGMNSIRLCRFIFCPICRNIGHEFTNPPHPGRLRCTGWPE